MTMFHTNVMQKPLALFTGLLAGGAVAFSTIPAQAASFNATDAAGCAGQTTCNVNGFTLTADPAGYKITSKNLDGNLGIGVSANGEAKAPDPSWGEIDFGEALKVLLPSTSVLEYLDLGFLFQPGVNHDRVFEQLKVTTNTGLEAILKITGTTTATWSFLGSGSVVNIDPSLKGDGGIYRVWNPFADNKISSFTITVPVREYNRNQSWGSDGVLIGAGTATVPEPGTMAALAGVVTVAGLGLRRSKEQSDA
jgi:hypothetical protein